LPSSTLHVDARVTQIELYNNTILKQGPTSLNYPNRHFIYEDSNKITYGTTYDFRIAYFNNSKITTNNPINYAYITESFGAFGPSNPPASIQWNSSSYKTLLLSGSGSNTIDASLNYLWSSAPPPNVGYGATWKAQKNPNAKQVGGTTSSYPATLFTYNDPLTTGATQNWASPSPPTINDFLTQNNSLREVLALWY